MKDLIVPVNNEALSRAMIACVGEQAAKLITLSYQEIDKARAFGYERGVKETTEAQAAAHAAALENEYNDGYVDGVSDARSDPAKADAQIAALLDIDNFDDELEFDELEPKLNAHDEGESWGDDFSNAESH